MAEDASAADASQSRDPDREAAAHEVLNLVSLPIMGALAVLGLLGWVGTMWATKTFIAYVVVDSLWVVLRPGDFPVLPGAILLHHLATLLLLLMPLRYPHLGIYTCWDGLAEINTFILVIRRRLGMEQPVLKLAYWATFVAFRFVLYPVVLVWIYYETKTYATWECVMTCASQFALILFNLGMLALAYLGSRKKANGSSAGGAARVSRIPVAVWRAQGAGPTPRRASQQQSQRAAGGAARRVLHAGCLSRLAGARSVAMLGAGGGQNAGTTAVPYRVPSNARVSQRLRPRSMAQVAPALGITSRLLRL